MFKKWDVRMMCAFHVSNKTASCIAYKIISHFQFLINCSTWGIECLFTKNSLCTVESHKLFLVISNSKQPYKGKLHYS